MCIPRVYAILVVQTDLSGSMLEKIMGLLYDLAYGVTGVIFSGFQARDLQLGKRHRRWPNRAAISSTPAEPVCPGDIFRYVD